MVNWKYVLIVAILATFVSMGAFYQWQALKEEVKKSDIEIQDKALETLREEENSQGGKIFPNETPKENQVIIASDKTEYKMGELINLTLRNESEKAICYSRDPCGGGSYMPDFDLEKRKNGEWVRAKEEDDILRSCHIGTYSGCHKIEPGEKKSVNIERTLIPSFKYRFNIEIGNKCDTNLACVGDKGLFYSNELTIKEDPQLIVELKGVVVSHPRVATIGIKTEDGTVYDILKKVNELKKFQGSEVIIKGYLTGLAQYGSVGRSEKSIYVIDFEIAK